MRPRFSFYGDDFTGSTDALEACASSGLRTVLFLRTPGDADLREFAEYQAVGIAGDSRSRSPECMSGTLPGVFERLREIGAPVVQYKVCSTFDSAPEVGSIGRALEIGQDVFRTSFVPVVAAAPLMGRYVLFGNLFAAGGGAIHRIDRHPSMSRHPVTPMGESDLTIHLSRQTSRGVGLVNIVELRGDRAVLPEGAAAVLFDGLEAGDLREAARLVWERRSASQIFAVGSSGFTYGMLDYWRSAGMLEESAATERAAGAPPDRLLVVAGSCSPATERQISRALRNGFHGVRMNPSELEHADAEAEALRQLAAGRSVILYSALGPADRVPIADRHALAASMGRMLRRVIAVSGVRRVVVAGGDTSSHAVQELDITALTFAAALTPGAPLCRAHGGASGLELVLKGGQVGPENFFEEVLSCP